MARFSYSLQSQSSQEGPTTMFSRRELLRTVSAGFGYLAFAGMSTLEAKRLLGDDQESAA